MTPTQFRLALDHLGFAESGRDDDLGISAFSRWLGINPRTVRGWLGDRGKVHPAVAKLLRLMVRLKLKPGDV